MANQSKIKNLAQRQAKQAYEFAEAGSKLNKEKKVDKAYKSYVKKIPMLIKTNGLGATFAFVKAKAKSDKSKKEYAYNLIYQQTEKWLKERMPYIFKDDDDKDLVYIFINQNSDIYRQITVEVLALFTWLRRFAEGLIEEEDKKNGEGQTDSYQN
jgi:CRISPR-associated protein Cmr5